MSQESDRDSEVPVEEATQSNEVEALKLRVGELEQQLLKSREEADLILNRFKYLQADFDNYRKQAAKEAYKIHQAAVERIILEILVVKDDLDRALQLASHGKPIIEGVKLVAENLDRLLKKEGVEKIHALGKPFNYEEHEAMSFTEDPSTAENTVAKELRVGYKLRGKVIRTTLVEVVKHHQQSSEESEEK